MTKRKVAMVLSGGASLGSYMAGALDELMSAFASSDDYEIDIITGASAGATTAAIIAHGLLYRNGKTALEDIWVRGIDMADLLDKELPNDEALTLLSARPMHKLSREALTWKDLNDKGQRAAFCAERLTLAMTLANTTALPYVSRVKQTTADGEEEFIQYRHSEQESFLLGSVFPPTDPIWERISDVVRASSSIPLVFPLVPLTRRADNDFQYIQKPSFDGEARFWYYDGGTFNNLPLDLAWHYAVRAAGSLDDRIIIVVNPWRSGIGQIDKQAPEPSVLQQALGLLSAVMRESSAIQFENEVALPSRQASQPSVEESDVLRALPGVDQAPVEVLGKFALVMPRRDDSRLRGNHLSALGAFLDRRFREYDFRRGAVDARHVALKRLGIPEYDTGRAPGFYEPDKDENLALDVSTYDKLGSITSARDPNLSVREVFEAGLKARIGALMRRWDGPGPNFIEFVLDPVIANFVAGYAIDKLPSMWEV